MIVSGVESKFIKFVIAFGIESVCFWCGIFRKSWLQRAWIGRRSFMMNYYRDCINFQVSKLTTLLSENVVSQSEVTLALGYLMGDTCLYRAACEEPHVAKEYLRAAEIIIETMKLLPQYVVWSNIVSLN